MRQFYNLLWKGQFKVYNKKKIKKNIKNIYEISEFKVQAGEATVPPLRIHVEWWHDLAHGQPQKSKTKIKKIQKT